MEYADAIEQTIAENNIGYAIVRPGYVDEDVLRALYSTALGLAYPSFFEGFGLPIIESLQCGTPVIVSNSTSLPEVMGNAGLAIDPSDPLAIAGAMEQFLSDRTKYTLLKKHAIEQASRFSWKTSALQTYAVYEQVTA